MPVAQASGVISVEYKKVGMTLNVTPHIDPLENIETLLEIESSTVSGEGAQGAPIIRAHTMNTAVNVNEGLTIVLGGLAGQNDLKALANHNPNNEPTLFQANYDNSRRRNDTEVVIFVTPRVIRDAQMANRDVKLNATREFRKIELENLRQVFVETYR